MEWIDYCKSHISSLNSYYSKMMYGARLNLQNPTLFTEKMQWLKIYDSTFLKTYCTDKITIHDYVQTCLGTDICIPLINTYNNVNEINFNTLPEQFVIKCNHGCKMNIIVKSKSHHNLGNIKNTLSQWMNIDFSNRNGCELHYKNIPHKILVEEYKETQGHSDLTDFKFYCFNGNPIFCQVITDRHSRILLSHYDMDWNYAPEYDWVEYNSANITEKPINFELMKTYSKQLSEPFKLCRCDFYEINGELYLGELTFTPNSGFHHFKNKNMNRILGDLLKL